MGAASVNGNRVLERASTEGGVQRCECIECRCERGGAWGAAEGRVQQRLPEELAAVQSERGGGGRDAMEVDVQAHLRVRRKNSDNKES